MFKYAHDDKVVHETIKGIGTVESRADHVTDGISYLVLYQAHDEAGNAVGNPVRNWWPEAQLELHKE